MRRSRLLRKGSRKPTVSERDLVLLGEVLNVVEDKSPEEEQAIGRVQRVLIANLKK